MNITKYCKGIRLLIFLFIYTLLIYAYLTQISPSIIRSIPTETETTTVLPKIIEVERVLIIYVWANIDAQSLANLQFFIRYGVDASQPADYYFILQQVGNKPVNELLLPILPPNAHYIQHNNECYDYGTIGWFLRGNIVNTSLYKYFIFMNSSVRGPFFVAYFDNEATWWFTIFTKRLNNETKLVGPTISCEGKPHVQSYLLVTDQVGLAILTGNKSGVFNCHENYRDAVSNGEIAASQMILHANYQIASLQVKYQGWDFRKPEHSGCNSRSSPIYYDNRFDGISHDPYELIFVKFKGAPPFDTDLERRALVYQKWLEEQPRTKAKNLTSIA